MAAVTPRDQRYPDQPQRPRGSTNLGESPRLTSQPPAHSLLGARPRSQSLSPVPPQCTNPSSGHRPQTGPQFCQPRPPAPLLGGQLHFPTYPVPASLQTPLCPGPRLTHCSDPCHPFRTGIHVSFCQQTSLISLPPATPRSISPQCLLVHCNTSSHPKDGSG